MKLSVCIITKDEEENLKRCLEHLSKYPLEIVVVDTGSKDRSVDVAKKYTSSVYHFPWCNDFAKAKNFAVSKASYDMVMVVDSDEYVIQLDLDKLLEMIQTYPKSIGRVKRINFINQSGEIRESSEYINRIFDRRYVEYQGRIHEQLISKDNREISTYLTPVVMEHSGYLLSKEQKMLKTSRNIQLLTEMLQEEGEDPYILYQLGKSYALAEQPDEAVAYFSKALTYDLDERLEYVIDMVESYGYALLNSGRAEEALGFFGLEETFGNTSDFLFLLGLIYMNNELFEEAIDAFERAVRTHRARMKGTDSYLAYYNAGVICECLGQMQRAEKYYKKASGYEPAENRLKEILKK